MPIIDAQIHLWRKGIGTPPHQTAPYLLEDAIRDMDEAGVDGAIIHPPASWDPDSNEQAVEAVQAHPDRFRILAYPPLDRPESPDLIRCWKDRPGVLGFRFYFNKPENRNWPKIQSSSQPLRGLKMKMRATALLATGRGQNRLSK